MIVTTPPAADHVAAPSLWKRFAEQLQQIDEKTLRMIGCAMIVVGLIALQRHAEMLQRAMSVFHAEFNRAAVEDLPRI